MNSNQRQIINALNSQDSEHNCSRAFKKKTINGFKIPILINTDVSGPQGQNLSLGTSILDRVSPDQWVLGWIISPKRDLIPNLSQNFEGIYMSSKQGQ